jgi:SagB-type dehydrogenase family enzyme
LDQVLAYHERTKHHLHQYARSLGYLDWNTQPNPFRRYTGSKQLPLDEVGPTFEPLYDALYSRGSIKPRAVGRASISQLFYDCLALSAWKQLGGSKWSLRVNPSSGALHPTEGYLLAGPVAHLSEVPALYHYAPFEHGLELRRSSPEDEWSALQQGLPPGALFVGLTSIHWRESWKYGERAFRYCHHDVGHAIAAVALSASALGWQTCLLEGWADRELAVLLGVAGQQGIEAEHPDCLLALYPSDEEYPLEQRRAHRPGADLLARLSNLPLSGEPNQLSQGHHEWPVIDEVAAASLRAENPPQSYWHSPEVEQLDLTTQQRRLSARQIIRQRRSAVAMDGETSLSRETFYGMLGNVMPSPSDAPFVSLPWKPAIHLALFVHRVEGLDRGLYCLVREAAALDDLKAAMRQEFEWSRPDGCPDSLPLFQLMKGDTRNTARGVSCHQDIASDGAFALAMIAEFEPRLRQHGPWFYKRLHWEAGAIGQVLYLEAEAAGVRATGIGCFFDDALHDIVGLAGRQFQDLYHFTVGGAIDDPRLKTLPAYAHRK